MPFNRPKGFTLVELIVVITLLSILGTIGYVSFSGYVRDSRDSVRLSDLNGISKALEVAYTRTARFPTPDGPSILLYGTDPSNPVATQGYAAKGVLGAVRYSADAKDPSIGTPYTYLVSSSGSKYQLTGFTESPFASSPIITDTAYAANGSTQYENRTPLVRGKAIGTILGRGNTGDTFGGKNQPIQELYDPLTFTGLDLANTPLGFSALVSSDTILSGTGERLMDFADPEATKALVKLDALNARSGKPPRVLVIFKVYDPNFESGSTLENLYRSKGYEVISDTGATTLEKVKAYSPDLVVCDGAAWSCGLSFLNTLYDAGFHILSWGNDTNNSIRPIVTGSNAAISAGSIIPAKNTHFMSRNWDTIAYSGDSGSYVISTIHPSAIVIGRSQTSNAIEAVYLEEPNKGRWFHVQARISNWQSDFFNQFNAYLLR